MFRNLLAVPMALLALAACGAEPSQVEEKPTAQLSQALVPAVGTYYYVRSQTSGKYLDSSSVAVNGTIVKQYHFVTSSNLQWRLIDKGSGWYYVQNSRSGLCLDNGGSTSNGTVIKLYDCNYSGPSANNLKFALDDAGGGRYRLRNARSGKCLDQGGSLADGSQIKQYTCVNSPNLAWTFQTELEAKCTPSFTLDLIDTGPGGQLFMDAVNNDPEGFVQEVGRGVCQILYRNASEVRDANHITLTIENYDGAAAKSGDVGDIQVWISTQYLQDFANGGGDVATEVRGILYHEMTHMYQNDDKATGEGTYSNLGNVIEGVADAVRIRGGFKPSGAVPIKTGSWDDQGYKKPAFFLLYVDKAWPNFVYRMNLSMKAGDGQAWTPASFQTITGKSDSQWWSEYQAAACCSGSTQTCCN